MEPESTPWWNPAVWSDDAAWNDPARHTNITTIEMQASTPPTSKYSGTIIIITRRRLDGVGLATCHISIPTTELSKMLYAQ